jgi:hypothetical protein
MDGLRMLHGHSGGLNLFQRKVHDFSFSIMAELKATLYSIAPTDLSAL